jgi:hypothetical protein
MKKRLQVFFTLSLLMLFLLSGCVNLVQEMSVSEDGSGTMRFAIGVDSSAYTQFKQSIPEGYQLENLLAALIQNESITDVQEDRYEAGGQTWDSITLEVADFRLLFEEERRIGPLVISVDQNEDVFIFSQTMDLTGSNLQIPGINLMNLVDAGYVVRLYSPQIVETNGVQTSAEVSEWEIPLDEFLQGGEEIDLQAEYKLEPYEGVYIPWEVFYPYIVIGFLGIGVLSVIIVIVVNTRKKDEEIDQIKFDIKS